MYALFADAIEPVAYALDEALSDEKYVQHDEDAYNAVRVLLMADGLFQSRANQGVLDEAGATFHDPNLVIALDIALKSGSESLATVQRRKASSASRCKHGVPAATDPSVNT